MKKMLKQMVDIKHWKKKTKTRTAVIFVLIVAAIVLAVLRPAEESLRAKASPQMQELLQKDAESDRKRVTITYNSLFVINYCSFSSSGKEALSERYVGFAGQIYAADEDAADTAAFVRPVGQAELRDDRWLWFGVLWKQPNNRKYRLVYRARAVTPGVYAVPGITIEDMYNPDFRGGVEGDGVFRVE